MAVKTGLDFFVQWHLTERCNLRCRHCYQGQGVTEEMEDSRLREVAAEIRETVDAWSREQDVTLRPSVTLTGGEPFLRPGFLDILAEIRRLGFEVDVLSNGTLIDAGRALRLAELGVRSVQVSLEGPEEIHEQIRGSGSYAAALRGVENLLAAGLAVNLNVTLSELNAGVFGRMKELAARLGVPRIGFSRLVPSGRGRALLGQALGRSRLEEVYREILAGGRDGPELVTGDPVAARMSRPGEEAPDVRVPIGGCAAALSGITIMPDGTLLPCRRLPVPLGNILRDSLREVWITSPVLGSLRDRASYGGKCGRCPRWALCRGCRAVAWAWTAAEGGGDFLAEDPQCFLDA